MAPSGQMDVQALLKDAALAGNWTLDASKSTVGLRSKSMWGMAPVKGVFRQVSGQGTVSPAGDVNGTVTVGAASIDTKNKKRDTHLRSADFFDSDTYPDITFTVTQARPSGQGVTVSGNLAVRDQHQARHLRRHGVRRQRQRGIARRRGPGRPVGLRPDLEPDGHGLHAQHHHRSCRVYQALSSTAAALSRVVWRRPGTEPSRVVWRRPGTDRPAARNGTLAEYLRRNHAVTYDTSA